MITNTILLTNLYDALDGPISSNGNNEYFQGILSRDLIKQTLYVLENLLTHFKGVFDEFFRCKAHRPGTGCNQKLTSPSDNTN